MGLPYGVAGPLSLKLSVKLPLNGSSEKPLLQLPRVLSMGDVGMLWMGLLFKLLWVGDEMKRGVLVPLTLVSKSVYPILSTSSSYKPPRESPVSSPCKLPKVSPLYKPFRASSTSSYKSLDVSRKSSYKPLEASSGSVPAAK